MQLVLQPCSDPHARKHYVDTIENPVSLSRILPHLKPEERVAVEATFPTAVAVWGVTPGKNSVNATKWHRVKLGDSALLYRDRAFFFRGTIAYKTHAPDLAYELWGTNESGDTWEHVFFLTDLEPLEISISRFNTAAGYQPNFIVQGFNVLSPNRSESILDALGLEPGVGATLPSDEDAESAKAALASLEGDLNVPMTVHRRKEQMVLRTILLGKKSHENCSVCGRNLPVDLLVVGHIRKRHSCSDDLKKNLGNVMAVCVLGCDSLFEHGYIYVDDAGVIRSSEQLDPRPHVIAATGALVGRTCAAWNVASEHFFAWHRKNPRRFV